MTVRPLTRLQRDILDKAWAEGLNGRDKLYAQVRASHPEAGITQRQVAAYLRTNQPHQLFQYQRKTKPVTVIRRSRPLQLVTVDLGQILPITLNTIYRICTKTPTTTTPMTITMVSRIHKEHVSPMWPTWPYARNNLPHFFPWPGPNSLTAPRI